MGGLPRSRKLIRSDGNVLGTSWDFSWNQLNSHLLNIASSPKQTWGFTFFCLGTWVLMYLNLNHPFWVCNRLYPQKTLCFTLCGYPVTWVHGFLLMYLGTFYQTHSFWVLHQKLARRHLCTKVEVIAPKTDNLKPINSIGHLQTFFFIVQE